MDDIEEYLLAITSIERSILYDFEYLETFGNKIEELIRKEKKKHDKFAKKMLVGTNEEEKEILSDMLSEDGLLLAKELPEFIRSSMLISCFSKLSHQCSTFEVNSISASRTTVSSELASSTGAWGPYWQIQIRSWGSTAR